MTSSQIQKKPQNISAYLRSDVVRKNMEQSIGQNRAGQLASSLMSLVNSNVVLQDCDPKTVFAAAMTAAALDLPINPSLGQAYIIPFNNKVKVGVDNRGKAKYAWVKQAQFQMGYKGFIQLGLRSGKYKTMNTTDVREGEYQGEDHMTGELNMEWIKKDRAKASVVGYLAYIELTTGFRKALYMSNEELNRHAKKYSKSFQDGYGRWVDDFDSMARKTVLKLLIDRWGIKTTSIERALVADQAEVDDDGRVKYVDNKDGSSYVEPVENSAKKD